MYRLNVFSRLPPICLRLDRDVICRLDRKIIEGVPKFKNFDYTSCESPEEWEEYIQFFVDYPFVQAIVQCFLSV